MTQHRTLNNKSDHTCQCEALKSPPNRSICNYNFLTVLETGPRHSGYGWIWTSEIESRQGGKYGLSFKRIQWAPIPATPGINHTRREAIHSPPPPSAKFKNTALPPPPTWIHEKHRDNQIFALFLMYPMILCVLTTQKSSLMPRLHNPNTVCWKVCKNGEIK